jgi:hypothetical protein
MPTDEEAEELVEPTRLRMMRGIKALVPLADECRGIARIVQTLAIVR